MEKFSKFRDAATGVAPFQIPKKPADEDGPAAAALQRVLGTLLFPLVLATLLLYVFVLSWLPGVGQLFLNVVVLRSLRILYSSLNYDGERRVTVSKRSLKKLSAGDVVIANFVSPLDPFVWASHHKAVFVFPAESGSGFVRVGLVAASLQALTVHALSAASLPLEKIVEDAGRAGSIVVLFAEGTTSNGKGLLPLDRVNFRALAVSDAPVYVAAIRYTPGTVASPMPRSLPSYLWQLTSTAWWYMVSIKISGAPLAKSLVSKDGVSKALTNTGRLRQIGDNLNIYAKRDYVKAYEKMRGS